MIFSAILDTVISNEGAQSHKGHHGVDPSAGVREQTVGTQDGTRIVCCEMGSLREQEALGEGGGEDPS